MSYRFHAWPERAHPVSAVLLAVALCAAPVVLPHFRIQDMLGLGFAYFMCCLLVFPVASVLRRRVTHPLALWAVAMLILAALCLFHTNIITDTAALPWPERRDLSVGKFLFNLPQTSLGVLVWWLLVLRPDRRH